MDVSRWSQPAWDYCPQILRSNSRRWRCLMIFGSRFGSVRYGLCNYSWPGLSRKVVWFENLLQQRWLNLAHFPALETKEKFKPGFHLRRRHKRKRKHEGARRNNSHKCKRKRNVSTTISKPSVLLCLCLRLRQCMSSLRCKWLMLTLTLMPTSLVKTRL